MTDHDYTRTGNYALMLDVAQARIGALENELATARDQVRTLQDLLHGDLDTSRMLREKLCALCDAAEESAQIPCGDVDAPRIDALQAAIAAAREVLP